MATTCTCDNTADHIIARAITADGKHVLLWADGVLTWALGYAIRGAGRARTAPQRKAALIAGWLVMGDACLYDAEELPALIAAARWAAAHDGTPAAMRARFATIARKATLPSPQWTIVSTNRDGHPTCRVWQLHRLSRWSGYAVWHEKGKYELMFRVSHKHSHDITYERTGFTFSRLHDVQTFLSDNQPKEIAA